MSRSVKNAPATAPEQSKKRRAAASKPARTRTPKARAPKSARKARPARRPPGMLRRLGRRMPWRSLGILAVTTALIGTGHWLWSSGRLQSAWESTLEKTYAFTVDAGLSVQSIQVIGRRQAGNEEILAALDTEQGAPILRFDPEAARQRVEALSWVGKASVERRLPGLIVVRIEERTPAALWQSNGVWAVIDDQGRLIEGAEPGEHAELPKVVGHGAERRVGEILALFALQPGLAEEVYAAVRVGNRRWNLRLHSGIDVRLPEGDPLSAWERLARLESVADLLSRDVTVIDLRRADRLLLRLAPDAEVVQPQPGQET